MTLLEIQERLIANCGERFAVSVLWRFFDRHEITFKKTAHAEEQQRADVQSRRREWFAGQLDLDPTKLVFVDETGASTNLARKSGRCRRGRRLRAAIPHSHYKTVTLVAGLRLRGLTAAKTFDGPINAALFEDWLETGLVPTLSPGEIVVMDNLPAHKGPRVEQLIKAAGAELRYLPAYSPDMNPSKKPSPSSKPSCAKSPNGPSLASCAPSKPAPKSSSPRNVQITSNPVVMSTIQDDRIERTRCAGAAARLLS